MGARLAAISDDLSSDFADAARLAADLGLSGLAVRHVDGRNVRDLERDAVVGVRRTADRHGLAITAVSSPLGRDLSLDDDPAEALALLDRMIEHAHRLGTDLIRFFACWMPGQDPVEAWPERPDLVAALPRLVDRLGAFAERAQQADVTLMLELEGASYAGQVAEAATLLTAVGAPSLALCWDVCNGWWSGEDPVAVGLPSALRLPVVDVQTKDVRARADDPTRPDRAQVVLGQGAIDYATIVAALLRSGYAGWFTAERVYHPRRPEAERPLQDAIIADLHQLRVLVG